MKQIFLLAIHGFMDRIVAVVVCFINTVINRLNSLSWNWKSSLSFNTIFLRNTTQNPCNGNVQAHTSTTRLKFYYWQKIDIRTLKLWESNSQVQRIVCVFFSSDIYDGSLKQVRVTMQASKCGRPYAVSGKITLKGHCCFIFWEVPNSFERTPRCDKAVSTSVSLDALQSVIRTTTRPDHLSFTSEENEVERGYDLSKTKEVIIWQSQMFHKGSRKKRIRDSDSL